MKLHILLGVLLLLVATAAPAQTITVDVANPTHTVSPLLFGAFFEEINLAGDGGLYGELVRNRSFNNAVAGSTSTNAIAYWTLVKQGSATGQMAVDYTNPLNVTGTSALKLTMLSGRGSIGAANGGYFGIPLKSGSTYNLSLYATGSSGFTGPLTVQLESASGSTVYAQTSFSGITTNWQKFTASLTPTTSDTNAQLVVSIAQPGTVWLDVVSLFPQATFNNRANGLRPDLANMVAAMNPAFLRFPGGNFIEGNTLTTAERWKTTIGDVSTRPGHWNSAWNYLSTDGLGQLEFLQFCEDLGMQPVFDINSGQALGSNGGSTNTVPLASMGPWVQDAPDAVEYATGATTTTWGAQRAANGHPAAFTMPIMEIGNETSGTYYNQRYALFYAALTGSYPDIQMISPDWGGVEESSEPLDIVDQHYYTSPATFESYATMYDSYSRTGPKIFVGEYAVTSGYGTYGNLSAALGEAAFMTGLERNSDIVMMASYAPLFGNVNNLNWTPDAIYYDNSRVFGTPSYYVQKMFATNTGSNEASVTIGNYPSNYYGGIGCSTWSTQSEFSNIEVTSTSGQVLYQSSFPTTGTAGWSVVSGTWAVSATDGALQQTGADDPAMAVMSAGSQWTNYTLSLQARKISGSEGFLIMFYVGSTNTWVCWNIGGWTNTADGIQQDVNGTWTTLTQQLASGATFAPIQTGVWYNISIQVNGNSVNCYLNGVLTQSVTLPPLQNSYYGGIGCATWSTQAEFSNIQVTSTSGQVLYQSSFPTTGTAGWSVESGTWAVSATDGALQQTANDDPDMAVMGAGDQWTNYTLSLQARKISGSEGFLIMFYVASTNTWVWWNIGGWGNTSDGIEQEISGTKTALTRQLASGATFAAVQTGVWYNISIQVNGNSVNCYLNGVLTQSVTLPESNPIFASASISPSTSEVIIKAVNPNATGYPATVSLTGLPSISSTAPMTVLTALTGTAENSFAAPYNVSPVAQTLSTPSTQFTMILPAYSLSVLRVQAPVAQPQNATVTSTNGTAVITWSPSTGASTYTVERATSAGGPWTVIGSGITGQTFTDTTAQPGAVYFYNVIAANVVGTSAASADLVAMPVVPAATIAQQGANALITVPSASGVTYQLQQAPSLSGTAWINLGVPVPGTGLPVQVTSTNGMLNGRAFYRFNMTLPSP